MHIIYEPLFVAKRVVQAAVLCLVTARADLLSGTRLAPDRPEEAPQLLQQRTG